MRALIVAAVAVLALPAAAQQAPAPSPSKFELAVRTGFGLPLGKIADGDNDLSDSVTGQIPLWLDALYRINPSLLVGLYLQYGFMLPNDCPEDSDCSGHDLRIGAQLHYHLKPGQSFDPWLGFGVGYESMTFEISQGFISGSVDATGWEFANLQAGGDIVVSPHFLLGPFVSFSMGEITEVDFLVNSSDFDKALHYWLVFGVRGRFDL